MRDIQQILNQFLPYVEKELIAGTALKHITRHILGLFQGQAGAKKFRRYLSENAHRPDADIHTLIHAAELVEGQ